MSSLFLCLSGSPALLPHSFPRLPAADKWEFVSEARHSLRGSVRLKDKGVAIATPLSFVVVQIREPATFEALLFKGGFGRIVNITHSWAHRRREFRVPLSAQREDDVFLFLCLSGSPALLPHSFPRLPAADKWEFVSEARHPLRGSVRLTTQGKANTIGRCWLAKFSIFRC